MDNEKLNSLLWAAKLLEGLMTEKEKILMEREQKISFVWGNTKLSNQDITREMVEKAVDNQK